MKPIFYHLINAAIAGGLVTLGSLSTIFTADPTPKEILLGFIIGLIAGLIIFLNKFNDWFNTQDPDCQKLFQFI